MKPAAGAILLAAAIACGGAPAWAAEPVRADLSDHVVAITTGFTGTSLVLFGARQEPGEIVIVVRGPSARAVVRRRHHVLGFWLNTEGASFDDVPAFYATISNRPLDEIASAEVLRLHRIGIQYLHPALRDRSDLGARREADYRAALVRRQERAGRFVEKVGRSTSWAIICSGPRWLSLRTFRSASTPWRFSCSATARWWRARPCP